MSVIIACSMVETYGPMILNSRLSAGSLSSNWLLKYCSLPKGRSENASSLTQSTRTDSKCGGGVKLILPNLGAHHSYGTTNRTAASFGGFHASGAASVFSPAVGSGGQSMLKYLRWSPSSGAYPLTPRPANTAFLVRRRCST